MVFSRRCSAWSGSPYREYSTWWWRWWLRRRAWGPRLQWEKYAFDGAFSWFWPTLSHLQETRTMVEMYSPTDWAFHSQLEQFLSRDLLRARICSLWMLFCSCTWLGVPWCRDLQLEEKKVIQHQKGHGDGLKVKLEEKKIIQHQKSLGDGINVAEGDGHWFVLHQRSFRLC